MNKIFKLILVLSLLIFSAVSISGCSSEKEKIAKEYIGTWEYYSESGGYGGKTVNHGFLVIKQDEKNENLLNTKFTKGSFFVAEKKESRKPSPFDPIWMQQSKPIENKPSYSNHDSWNLVYNEKSKLYEVNPMQPVIVKTENGIQTISLYNTKGFRKISNEPKNITNEDITFQKPEITKK